MSKLLEETPEAYYWIGFLLADGWFIFENNTISLYIEKDDKEHVVKYSNFMERTEEVSTILRKTNYGECVVCGFGVGNFEVFPHIVNKFGISGNKTEEPPTLLKNIKNKDLLFSLIIGYLDGDGTIVDVRKGQTNNIRVEVHPNWLPILIYFEDELYNYINWKKFGNNLRMSHINTRDYAFLCIADTYTQVKIKDKIKLLNIPALDRKWDHIDNSILGSSVTILNRISQIQELIYNGKQFNEIAEELKMKNKSLRNYITKKLKFNKKCLKLIEELKSFKGYGN